MRGALEWFRRERAWINDQHLKVCRVPAPTFFEAQRASWMAEQFHALGWQARLDRVGNVIATLPEFEGLPCVAVTAHLDTVFAPRSSDDIRLAEGRMTGPGVADNGPGLTGLLAIAAAWKANGPLDDLTSVPSPERAPLAPMLIANVGEEGEGNLSGMRYICKQVKEEGIRGFLILDGPGSEHVTWRALASRRFDVILNGPGGHSWRDFGMVNPVNALSRMVALFNDSFADLFPADLKGLRHSGEDDARATYNFGVFEGGSSINAIPTEAHVKVDLRSEDGDRIERMTALLASTLERALETENSRATGGKLSAKLKEIGYRPSGCLPSDAPILDCIRAVDAHLRIRTHYDCSSTDANIPLSLGLQAVSIGAGGTGGGAHTSAEWYSPEGRELGLRRAMLALGILLLND